MIGIKPAPCHRQSFAKWARDRGCAMRSSTEFQVRDQLIPEIPEELLEGSLLDGQVYVPADHQVNT